MGARIGELKATLEQPRRDRLEETPLQLARGRRLMECERRDDGELQRRIVRDPPVERVRELIRLAQAERQREYNVLADRGQNRIDAAFGVGVVDRPGLRRRVPHERAQPASTIVRQPGSGLKRGPCLLSSRSSAATIATAPRALA